MRYIDEYEADYAINCLVLPSNRILAVMNKHLSFFTQELEYTHDVSVSSMIDGLEYTNYFVPVTQDKDCDFMMVSKIEDLASIESHGISHQYTGEEEDDDFRSLMTGMSMSGMKGGEASEKPTR